MKRLHLAAALACLLGPGAPALAQTAAGVADPQAAVPATPYASPLRRDTPAASSPSPDQAWRAANATVGGRNAMSLTMPGMGDTSGMSGHEMHGAAPAAPAATPAPASGHVHHAGMQMGDAAAAGPQCMAGGSDKGCGGGKSAAGEHAGHAGMAMNHGCCDHKEAK